MDVTIRTLDADGLLRRLDELSEVLHATVHAGASVGFVLPYDMDASRAFWRERVLPAVRGGGRVLLVALADDAVAGTVQLDTDTMPNQAHRGEVSKLLVHPRYRRRGIARRLMGALEVHARDRGRHLLTLDTRTGDHAEPLYRSLGFEVAGVIPGYCRSPEDDRFDGTTYMYKALPPASRVA